MITVTICSHSEVYRSFCVEGHADYAEEGSDIICAAVSALALNTVNSIEEFTDDPFRSEYGEGRLSLSFDSVPSHESGLLMDSLVLGINGIRKEYGDAYIQIEYEEV